MGSEKGKSNYNSEKNWDKAKNIAGKVGDGVLNFLGAFGGAFAQGYAQSVLNDNNNDYDDDEY